MLHIKDIEAFARINEALWRSHAAPGRGEATEGTDDAVRRSPALAFARLATGMMAPRPLWPLPPSAAPAGSDEPEPTAPEPASAADIAAPPETTAASDPAAADPAASGAEARREDADAPRACADPEIDPAGFAVSPDSPVEPEPPVDRAPEAVADPQEEPEPQRAEPPTAPVVFLPAAGPMPDADTEGDLDAGQVAGIRYDFDLVPRRPAAPLLIRPSTMMGIVARVLMFGRRR